MDDYDEKVNVRSYIFQVKQNLRQMAFIVFRHYGGELKNLGELFFKELKCLQ